MHSGPQRLTSINIGFLVAGLFVLFVWILITAVYFVLFYKRIVVYYRRKAKVAWPWWRKKYTNGERKCANII